LGGLCEDETISLVGTRSGAAAAFETIVRKHMKDAYFIALGLVGNHEDALELSQEAFFRAFRNYKQLHAKGKFFPWFYQILRNLCFSHLRKRRRRHADSLDGLDGEPIEADVYDHFDPEAVAERNESNDRLWKAIGQLDHKHREVIVLRHFQNLSYEQMANILFCNKGTVTSRLYYARKRLKEILDHQKGGRQ